MGNLILRTQAFVETFQLPDGKAFENDFRQLMNIFYVCGLYRPVASSANFAKSFIIFVLLMVTMLSGVFKDLIMTWICGDIYGTLLFATTCSLIFAVTIQSSNVVLKGGKITVMIKNLQSLHEGNEESMKVYQDLCSNLVKYYMIMSPLSIAMLALSKMFGFDFFKLIIPAIYDELAVGSFYNIFLFVSFVHILICSPLFMACELLHVLCMIRIEGNMKILGTKLRSCADGKNFTENEEKLNTCIKYHCAIIA